MRTVVELLTSSLGLDKKKNKQKQNGTDEASERRGREKRERCRFTGGQKKSPNTSQV